jgi:hypothetical protein
MVDLPLKELLIVGHKKKIELLVGEVKMENTC